MSWKNTLTNYFDKIYVITIKRATERQEHIRELLDGLNFSFFYGVDYHGIMNDHISLYKDSKWTRISFCTSYIEYAIALSHKTLYEKILNEPFEKVLIFEDDIVPDEKQLQNAEELFNSIPQNWELLYLGYWKNEKSSLYTSLKKGYYKLYNRTRLFGWDSLSLNFISNMYPSMVNDHFQTCGWHDGAHAYCVTKQSAEKLVNLFNSSEFKFTADFLLTYAALNGITSNSYSIINPLINQSERVDGKLISLKK
jgi:glycosyl transferase, family 25